MIYVIIAYGITYVLGHLLLDRLALVRHEVVKSRNANSLFPL